MKKLFPVVTDRLLLQPNNEEDFWNGEWTVSLKSEPDKAIGTLNLTRSKVPGEASVSVELEPDQRNKGYGSEIFYAISLFAFGPAKMKELYASCPNDNRICKRALENAKYIFRENKDGMDHYSVRKDKAAWTGLYVCIGFLGGLILGILISNLVAGMVIGLLAGFLIGRFLDSRENR